MCDEKGQTLIELALAVFLLFMVLFGITEFGSYFFQRNTLNSAARAGVRQAIVTPTLSPFTQNCGGPVDVIAIYVCSAISGADASVDVEVELFDIGGDSYGGTAATGDRVRVEVSSTFTILTGSIIPFFSGTRPIAGEASMRYEL